MKKILLNHENIKEIGRNHTINNILWLALSGSGIAFEYTGKELNITVLGGYIATADHDPLNHARIAFYINDVRVINDMVNYKEKTYRVFQSDTVQTVSVKVLKLSEAAMSVLGIRPLEIGDEETIVPAPKKEHLIEFIGDSITCGYGVDDEDPLHPFTTHTEDVTRAYAYKTAMALNADYSMCSYSGYGIISGYVAEPTEKLLSQLVPKYNESFAFSDDTLGVTPDEFIRPAEVPWDFNRIRPEAIVVNLGTNDDSYCQNEASRQEEYAEEYVRFLKTIRKNNPDAELFCVLGLMGDRLFPYVCKACGTYIIEPGDTRVHPLHLPPQDGSIGYVSDYHPLESAHQKAADYLAPEIKKIMCW